jgi:hypothetical protein
MLRERVMKRPSSGPFLIFLKKMDCTVYKVRREHKEKYRMEFTLEGKHLLEELGACGGGGLVGRRGNT